MKTFYPNFKFSIALFSFVFLTSSLFSQYYWVGGSGDWNDYSNHWATSSGGSTFHDAPPTQEDDVFFDSYSFSSAGNVVTLGDTDTYCRNLDCSDVTNFPAFTNDGHFFYCYGSMIFSPDMSLDFYYIRVYANDEMDITTNGNSLGENCRIQFLGTGIYNLTGNISLNQIAVNQGTFNSNGYDLDLNSFWISGSDSKMINIQNSTLEMNQWRLNGTSITLNAENSVIYTQAMYGDEDNTGDYEYDEIYFIEGGYSYGSYSANVLDFTACAGYTVRLEENQTITANYIYGIGTKANPIELNTDVNGSSATFSVPSGSVNLEYIVMRDIHAEGGANFNAIESLDYGNNMGWNITEIVPETYYWIGNGGNWSDVSHWSNTSGGAASFSEIPTRFDHVIFDQNSFTNASQTVTVDVLAKMFSMNSEAAENFAYISSPYDYPMETYGDFILGDEIDYSIYNLRLNGDAETYTFKTNLDGSHQNISFGGNGIYEIVNEVVCANFSVYGGEVNTNDHPVSVSYTFSLNSYNDEKLNLGASVVSCNNFNFYGDVDNDLDGTEATIHCRNEFRGNEGHYHHLILEEEGKITQNNTYDILEIDAGCSATLNAGTNSIAYEDIIMDGTSAEPIILSSSVDGEQATLTLASGTVDATFVVLKDNVATGGAVFNANQAIDNGNNVGWNITEIQPNDFYWVGNGGDWSDAANHWATSSGGSNFYSFVPGPLDNVYFDENSFSSDGQIVTLDLDQANVNDLDWSSIDQLVQFSGYDKQINIYGSMILSDLMTIDISDYHFLSEEAEVIDPGYIGSPGLNSYLYFESTGSWSLMDTLTTREIHFDGGDFESNNHGIHVDFNMSFDGADDRTIDFGTSNVFTRQLASYGVTNITIDAGQTSWYVSSSFSLSSCTNCDISFNDLTFVQFNSDQGNMYAGDILFNNFTIVPGKTVEFGGVTNTLVNQLHVTGTASEPIIMRSINDGNAATITQETGEVNGQYLELQDMIAAGGATFYANNSVDLGNVVGWIFSGTDQSISFPELDDVSETVGTINLGATATSGLDIFYVLIGGPAEINGDVMTVTGPGLIEVQASQPGDTEFNAAASVTQSFCSIPLDPTISADVFDVTANLISSSEEGNIWFFNGEEILGEISQVINVSDNGSYTVMVDVNGCSSNISEAYDLTTLSIELQSYIGLQFYPNPCQDFLFIEGLKAHDQVEIFTVDGKRLELNKTNLGAQGNMRLELQELASGLYVVKVSNNQNETQFRLYKE